MIRRYVAYLEDGGPWEDQAGEFVYHEDYLVEIKALQDEIVRLQSLLEFDLEDCK